MIGQPRAVGWPCEVQTWRKRACRTRIGMSDEASLREPAKPEPRVEVEHARIRKDNNRLIWRIELAQDPFHQQSSKSVVSVIGMRCHCADLVTVARLTIDHVPHGLAAHG